MDTNIDGSEGSGVHGEFLSTERVRHRKAQEEYLRAIGKGSRGILHMSAEARKKLDDLRDSQRTFQEATQLASR